MSLKINLHCIRIRRLPAYILATFTGIGGIFCAHQMAPGGGPEDTLRPAIVTSRPAPGSVNQGRRAKISLTFSEWVDEISVKRGVSVFPQPPLGFKTVISGRRLDIIPRGDLAESTTYHIEIATTGKDLHGLSLATPWHFVFSTGPVLDGGTVHGCIAFDNSKNEIPRIALYRVDSTAFHDSILLRIPDYLIQSDSAGAFMFTNIRRGSYALIGFYDADNNQRLTPGRDQSYASATRFFSVDTSAGPFALVPVNGDTAAVRITAITRQAPAVLLVQWDAAEPQGRSYADAIVAIEPLADSISRPRIVSVVRIGSSPRCVLFTDTVLPAVPYNLIYKPLRRMMVKDSAQAMRFDTLRLSATLLRDTLRPTQVIAPLTPPGDLWPRFSAVFSEPTRCLTSSWIMADTLGDTVAITLDTTFCDTLPFTPARRLTSGRTYRLAIPDSLFEDLSGAHFYDSARGHAFSYTYVAQHPDSVSLSLAGCGTCGPDPQRIWQFSPVRGGSGWKTPDSAGCFRFDSLVAGKGTLSFFIDANRDGKKTLGSLFPWVTSETSIAAEDSAEARARWDVDGIPFSSCDICSSAAAANRIRAKALRSPTGRY